MLRVYRPQGAHLVPTDLEVTAHSHAAEAEGAVWLDLLNPTRHEDHYVEHLLDLSIPTREEAQELEISARLYHEGGAEFMTMTGVTQLESDAPATTPITFILKGNQLVTVRYAEPKPFWTYATRVQKAGAVPCANGEHILLGLLEALIGRMAEALEGVGPAPAEGDRRGAAHLLASHVRPQADEAKGRPSRRVGEPPKGLQPGADHVHDRRPRQISLRVLWEAVRGAGAEPHAKG